MNQDNITLNGTIKEITMTEFLLNDARGEFIKTRTKRLAKMYEMFVTKKIKEDKETYKSYIQIFNNLRSNNSKLIIGNNLTKKPIKELEWGKFIEYYNIQYVISLIEVYYEKDSKRDELINKLHLDAFSKAIELNHPIVEIVKFVSNKTNTNILTTLSKENKISEKECGDIFLHIVEEKFNECKSHSQKIDNTDKDILESEYNQLINQEGGGTEEYNAIKNILEKIAEVKHDFTDAKRAPNFKKALGTKYNGSIETELNKLWSNHEKEDHIKSINDILKNPTDNLTSEATAQFPYLLSGIKVLIGKCLIDFKNTLLSSDHEPKLFNQLFLQKKLQKSSDGAGDLIHNRYKFFSYDTEVDESFNIFSLTVDGVAQSKKLVINFAQGIDLLENIKTILEDKEFIYDTSSGMPNTSKLLEDMSLKKLTPICNIWDPATASITALNNNLSQDRTNESLIEKLTDVKPIHDSLRKVKFDDHLEIEAKTHDLFSVSVNFKDDSTLLDTKTPISLTIQLLNLSLQHEKKAQNGYIGPINLKGGLSVNMLDTIYDWVITKSEFDESLWNVNFEKSIDKDSLTTLVNGLIKYFNEGHGGDTRKPQRKEIISLLIFDLKKTGDWSQVNWLNNNKRHFLVSGDKLCALYNIINDNKTLFGTTAQLKNKLISANLGIYINKNKVPEKKDIDYLIEEVTRKLDDFIPKYNNRITDIHDFTPIKIFISSNKWEEGDRQEEKRGKKTFLSTMLEILHNFSKLLDFSIETYSNDIKSINETLISSITRKFTSLTTSNYLTLSLLREDTSIETTGPGEKRRSRRVQSRLKNELENIESILGEIEPFTEDNNCNPAIGDKINSSLPENITNLFKSINSVDNIDYIYSSVPAVYSNSLHLIASITGDVGVKYELRDMFMKLFLNLGFKDETLNDKRYWEFGDQKNTTAEDYYTLQEASLLDAQSSSVQTRQTLIQAAEKLGIHLNTITSDLNSILYLINCILYSNYDSESQIVSDTANQISNILEKFNENIELSIIQPEASPAPSPEASPAPSPAGSTETTVLLRTGNESAASESNSQRQPSNLLQIIPLTGQTQEDPED